MARLASMSDQSGNFYFFQPENWEVLVKMVDGCAINGYYWAFVAAASNLGWEIGIVDTTTGAEWVVANTEGTFPQSQGTDGSVRV